MFLPSLTLPLSEVAVKFSRSDTLRGSVARQVAATATAGPTAAALGQVLAAPTTGHLAVLGATLGNLTSLVDCNAGGEFAANIVRPSLCSRSPSIVARVQNLSLHTNRFVFLASIVARAVFQPGTSDGRSRTRCCHTPAVAQHHHCDLRNSRASIDQTGHCQCRDRMMLSVCGSTMLSIICLQLSIV